MPAATQDITLVGRFDDQMTKPTAAGAGKLGSALGGLVLKAGAVGAGFLTVRTLAAKGLEFEALANKADGVSRSFGLLTQQAGQTADVFLGKLRTAARGTISDIDLMTKANQAALLIGAENLDKLPELIEVARASAAATGQDINFLFDSIVLGLGRQSKMILDNLGIIVNVDKANSDYARTLGKSASALTDAERKQAFLNATLAGGQKIIRDTGGAMENNAQVAARLAAQQENLAVAIGKHLQPALNETRKAFIFWLDLLERATRPEDAHLTRREKLSETEREYAAALDAQTVAQEKLDRVSGKTSDRTVVYAKVVMAAKTELNLATFEVERLERALTRLNKPLAEQKKIQAPAVSAAQRDAQLLLEIQAETAKQLMTAEEQGKFLRQQALMATGEERIRLVGEIAKTEVELHKQMLAEIKEFDDKEAADMKARLEARNTFVTDLSIAQSTLVSEIAEETGRNQTAIGRRFLIAQIQFLKEAVDKSLAIQQASAVGNILADPTLPFFAKLGPILAVTAKFSALRALVGLGAGAAISALSKPLEAQPEETAAGRSGRGGGGGGSRGRERAEAVTVAGGGDTQQIFLTVNALDPATVNWRQVTQDNIAPALNDLAERRVVVTTIQQT
jgi:hypothetical protein